MHAGECAVPNGITYFYFKYRSNCEISFETSQHQMIIHKDNAVKFLLLKFFSSQLLRIVLFQIHIIICTPPVKLNLWKRIGARQAFREVNVKVLP